MLTAGLKEQRPLSIPSFFVDFLTFRVKRALQLRHFFIVKNRLRALYCHVYVVIHMPETVIICPAAEADELRADCRVQARKMPA